MEGLRVKPLWMLAFIFIMNFSSLIYAKEVPSKEPPSKVVPSKEDECATWNAKGEDFETDCSNCRSHKTSDNTTCLFFVVRGHQDKGFCVSESHNKELKGFSQAFDCSWFTYPPYTSTEAPQSMSKSFKGGVFFGGIVFAIVLLMIFVYGWNKYQSKKNGTPIQYGMLYSSPKPDPTREGNGAK